MLGGVSALVLACGPGGFISGSDGRAQSDSDSIGDGDSTGDGDGDGDTTDDTTDDATADDETTGDRDEPCEVWQAAPPSGPLSADACLTQGSQPFASEPPEDPFPADPGEVVCGTGWGHGAPTPSFDWTVELDTLSGRQSFNLTPAADMLIISNSFPGGGEVLRYDAETGELLDGFDISDTFKHLGAIAVIDQDRWILADEGNYGSSDNEAFVTELQLGAVNWKTVISEQEIGPASLSLSHDGDLLLTSGDAFFPLRIERIGSDGTKLWSWTNDLNTPTAPHVIEAPDGSVIVSAASQLLVLDADGALQAELSPLSHRHMATAAVGDDLLVVGNGRADEDPNFMWLELARWSRGDAKIEWSREHRRALSWNGSTNLYNALYAVVPHPCGGFIVAGSLALQSPTCSSQPWIAALDDAGEIIWADRIHRCGGRPSLAVSPAGHVWVLTNFVTGTRPLLRRYSFG